ncbi:MAG: tetratricopeptide repeat protein [Lachnospiraceae bacterium]|nr:tetratricopeptide repeat protein [Lachnospiraceae bacterium]
MDYNKILNKSNELYNDALIKAGVNDLSGAIVSLKESLKNNKKNTDARNLLGLIFYARGNYVDAVAEWVISKNYQEENNRADVYLKEMRSAGNMEKADQNAERYNRALHFCKEGNLDLAKVQLKRINSSNVKDMEAYRLLALIYIKEKNYNEARKIIKAAQQVDVNDTVILRYKKELKDIEKTKKSKKKKKADLVNFSDGNDSVIMTRAAFKDFSDGSRTAIINIVTGIIIGVLFCYFLVIPTIKQNARNKATNSIINANESATNSANSVSELKDQVSNLKKELKKYSAKSDTATSYDQLIQAKNAVDAGDMTTASTLISQINLDLLSDNAKNLYNTLSGSVNNELLVSTIATARSSYQSGDYQAACDNYKKVIEIQENYEDGKALYELGQSYEKLSDFDNAIKTYNRVNELYPDAAIGKKAKSAADKAQAAKDAATNQ